MEREFSPFADVFDFHPKEFARQLTLGASILNKAIDANEWLSQGWEKGPVDSSLRKAVTRFNTISEWIATQCVLGETVEVRVSIIRYFVHVGQECMSLNNFSGVLEVASISSILRLIDRLFLV